MFLLELIQVFKVFLSVFIYTLCLSCLLVETHKSCFFSVSGLNGDVRLQTDCLSGNVQGAKLTGKLAHHSKNETVKIATCLEMQMKLESCTYDYRLPRPPHAPLFVFSFFISFEYTCVQTVFHKYTD